MRLLSTALVALALTLAACDSYDDSYSTPSGDAGTYGDTGTSGGDTGGDGDPPGDDDPYGGG